MSGEAAGRDGGDGEDPGGPADDEEPDRPSSAGVVEGGPLPHSAQRAASGWTSRVARRAEAESAPYVWLVEASPIMSASSSGGSAASNAGGGAAVGWLPLRLSDAQRLDRALARQRRHAKAAPNGASLQKMPLVPVYCGRYDVDLERRVLQPVYWDEPERRVIRSLWFHGNVGERIPYEEADSEELESAVERLTAGKERVPLLVPVNRGCHDVRFDEIPPDSDMSALSLFIGPSNPKDSLIGSFIGSVGEEEPPPKRYAAIQECVDRSVSQTATPVWRGYYGEGEEPAMNDEEDLPTWVESLVFVVHGIGQRHRMNYGSLERFHGEVAKVRALAVQRMTRRLAEGLPVPGRIEFLPLEWFEAIAIDAGIASRLQSVTLPSLPWIRDFANYAIADFMVYQDQEWQHRIHTGLLAKMDRLYRLFRQRTPNFSGAVGVIGHSLGSVIMFDLLQRMLPAGCRGLSTAAEAGAPEAAQAAPGDAPAAGGASGPSPTGEAEEPPGAEAGRGDGERCPAPRCLFAIGSPLGMFLSIRLSRRGQSAAANFRGLEVRWPVAHVAPGWRVFNVYHPDDPVAYRLEPLLNPRYAAVAPKVVPRQGGPRLHQQVYEWFRSAVSASASDGEDDVLLVPLQPGEDASPAAKPPAGEQVATHRIDYAIQQNLMEKVSETYSGFKSHLSYWDCEDLMQFVVDQMFDHCATKPPSPRARDASKFAP